MLATRLISLCTLAFLAPLCVAAGVQAGVIVPQSTETGTYLLQLTSATTSHAAATGAGVSTLGSFQAAGSQDSDFTRSIRSSATVSLPRTTVVRRSSARSAARPRPPARPARRLP